MVTHGSLFSGIGGFDAGFDRADIHTSWQCEIDPKATLILERHWPDTVRYRDIAEMDGSKAEPVDMITFGSPCQDLSVAGKRAGLDGGRSGLFFEANRVAAEMLEATGGTHPRFLVWENVVGALSSNSGRDFAAVLDALADVGALDIGWRVLDAQWFGVAQRRRRVFVVADLAGRRAGAVLDLAQGSEGGPAPSREAGTAVATLTANGVGGGGGPDDNAAQAGHLIPSLTDPSTDPSRLDDQATGQLVVFHARQDPITSDDVTPTLDTYGTSLAVLTNQRGEARAADVHSSLTATRSTTQYAGVLGPIGNHNADAAGARIRRLTVEECERLQGFPDGWTEPAGADTHRYRCLGNAVCVNVAAWLGRNIAEAMG